MAKPQSDEVAANAEWSGDQAAPSEKIELAAPGLTIALANGKSGLVVTDVDPDNNAADQGLKAEKGLSRSTI